MSMTKAGLRREGLQLDGCPREIEAGTVLATVHTVTPRTSLRSVRLKIVSAPMSSSMYSQLFRAPRRVWKQQSGYRNWYASLHCLQERRLLLRLKVQGFQLHNPKRLESLDPQVSPGVAVCCDSTSAPLQFACLRPENLLGPRTWPCCLSLWEGEPNKACRSL